MGYFGTNVQISIELPAVGELIPSPNPRALARSSPAFRHSCRGAAPTAARSGPCTLASDPPVATAARASSPPSPPASPPAHPSNALVQNLMPSSITPRMSSCHLGVMPDLSATVPPPPSPAALAAAAVGRPAHTDWLRPPSLAADRPVTVGHARSQQPRIQRSQILGFRHRRQTVGPLLELAASELLHQLGIWQGRA